MWLLQNLQHAENQIYLPAEKDLVVGRKDCEILITGDSSISRRHAIIRVSGKTQTSLVELTDSNSKFGTTINGKKLPSNTKVSLSLNDEIKFGQGPSTGKFRLVFKQLVFCCSSMSSSDKTKVKSLVSELGGKMTNSWNLTCTHLVMSNLTVTIKVVSALACCKPVITPLWIEAAVKCLRDGRSFPSTVSYLPTLVDTYLDSSDVSFKPNFKRRNLFQNKVFYFLSEKQYKDLQVCVQAASAKCQLINSPNSVPLDSFLAMESVVLSATGVVTPSSEKVWVDRVQQFLKQNHLRSIQDSEIGFALLHISIDSYCNPRHTQVSATPLPAPSLSQMPQPSYNSQSEAPPTPLPSHSVTSPSIRSSSRPLSDKVLDDDFSLSPVEVKSKIDLNTIVEDSRSPSLPSSKQNHLKKTISVVNPTMGIPGTQQSDVSIFAPSSLTPISQETSDRISRNNNLPSSGLMTELFEGKKTKRKNSAILREDNSDEDVGSPVMKKQRVIEPDNIRMSHDTPLPSHLQNKTELFAGIANRGSRKKVSKNQKSFVDVQPINKQERAYKVDIESENVGTYDCSDKGTGHMAKVYDNDDEAESPPVNSRNHVKDKSIVPVQSQTNTSDAEKGNSTPDFRIPRTLDPVLDIAQQTSSVPRRDTSEEYFVESVTPKKRKKTDSFITSSTPFLSTRKRTKKCPMNTEATPSSLVDSTVRTQSGLMDSTSNFSQKSFTSLTLGKFKDATLPLTAVSTGGIRTKVTPATAADALWMQEDRSEMVGGARDMDDEDPLGNDVCEIKRRYQPVLTDDGFIKPRATPKLNMSRMGRLALRAKTDFLTSPSSSELQSLTAPPQHVVHVAVSVVSLVVRDKGEDGGRRRKRDVETEETEERYSRSRLRDFKKFRKVKNAGSGVPRFLTLEVYVPEVDRELPDWEVMEGDEDEASPESSQRLESSQNVFSIHTRKKQSWRH